MKEEKNGFDISALLEEATEENERARAKQELRAAEENPLTKTIVAPPVGGEEIKEFPEHCAQIEFVFGRGTRNDSYKKCKYFGNSNI